MNKIDNIAIENAMKYFKLAEEEAKKSFCLRSKCGALIVKDNSIIGLGTNSPPGNRILERCLKDDLPKDFKSDRTCCIHAERRAIDNALDKVSRTTIQGSTLYFIRLDMNNQVLYAGKPYCTQCSKEALDVGVKEWVLFHEKGIYSYDSKEYNEISFGRMGWEL